MEERPRPAPASPRLPPGPVHTGTRSAPLRLEELAGAAREPGGALVVTTRLAPDARVGKGAPADALVADPALAGVLAGLPGPAPGDLLHGLRILDIETTGLSGGTGTLAFLVGVARFERDGALTVEQIVLPAPAAEACQLRRVHDALAGATLLVTFNGRSFDVPLLRTRCVLARVAPGPLSAPPHLDLLAVARRLWRTRVGECRLIALEERVLGRRRAEDLPGALAPAAYASFLRTGDARELGAILDHNRDDLAGTAALLGAALRILDDPGTHAEDASELLAAGEHRLRHGDPASARPLLDRAVALAKNPETLRRALTQLARLHRRAGRTADARSTWERYRKDFPRENLAYLELAKLFEHREKDPARALAVVESIPHPALDDVQRRLSRLRARLAPPAPPREL